MMRKLILTAMLALTTLITAFGDTETVDGYTWTYQNVDGGAAISAGHWSCAVSPKPTGDLTIPSTLGGYVVTRIGESAFYNCSGLTSVTIPSSVTSIGESAFHYCSGLTSVTIPSSVTNIGNWAFTECRGLTSVTIPSSVTNIGRGAFSGCYGLTSVTIPSSVTNIGANAFSCSGLTSVMIPKGVTSIGAGTFEWCGGLTSVAIPSSVTNIGESAFAGCYGLTSVTIPSSVTSIGEISFYYCSGLTSMTIPPSVTFIGENAFGGCDMLATVYVSSGDADRVEELLEKSGLGVEGLVFEELEDLTTFIVTFDLGEYGTRTGGGALSQVVRNGFSATAPTVAAEVGRAFDGWSGEFGCVTNDMTVVALYRSQVPADGVYTQTVNSVAWTFRVKGGKASVGGGTWDSPAVPLATAGAIVLPSELGSCPVTGISEQAFVCCEGLTTVTIPESVTSIAASAFHGCRGLESMIIPSSVTSIEWDVFSGCSGLTSVTIPSSVTSIGGGAFQDCSGLTSVTIPEGVTSIEAGAFGFCSGLKSVTIPSSVTSIGGWSFAGCSELTSMTIPGSVAFIDVCAFEYCDKLTTVYVLPGDAERVAKLFEESGFDDEEVEFVEMEGVTTFTVTFDLGNHGTRTGGGALSQIVRNGFAAVAPTVVVEPGWSFEGWSGAFDCVVNDMSVVALYSPNSADGVYTQTVDGIAWTYQISGGKASVGGGTSDSLAVPATTKGSITIPTTLGDCPVKSIGNWAFSGCSGLTSVKIPSGVTNIGDRAFSSCKGLGAVTIPSSVTSIGKYAFYECRNLMGATIPEGVTSVSEYTFCYCDWLNWVEIPSSVTNIGVGAFLDCKKLKSVTIPEGVTSIGAAAFHSCSGLTSVTIPSSVTSIGYAAFKGCSGLGDGVVCVNGCVLTVNGACPYDVMLPMGTRLIVGGVFEKCSGLTSVTIPEGVTSIGEKTFYGCYGLTSLTIPDGVTSIGDQAFYGCNGLTSVTIPSSVTSIGDQAFYCCSGLTSVEIPSGVTSIGAWTFCGCYNLTSVAIPSSVTSIGDLAFYGCEGLTSVTIPSSVTFIGDDAFENCNKLDTVYVSSGDADRVEDLLEESGFSVEWIEFVEIVVKFTVTFDLGELGVRTGGGALSQVVKSGFAAASPTVVAETGWTFDGWSGEFGCVTNDMTVVALYSQYQVLEDGVHTRMVDGIAWTFSISDGKASAGGGTYDSPAVSSATAGAISIPSTFGGCPVTSIGEWAFRYCTRLTSVTIPSCVTDVGQHVFLGCRGLTSLSVDADNPTYRSDHGLLLTKDGRTLIAGVNGDVAIPDGVMSIADYAFEGCSGLKSVKIPSSVTNIGAYAFKNCSGLKAVTIPSTVTSIDSNAFYGCDAVCEATLPGWKCGIAFKSVTNLVISSGTTSIDGSAFSGCSGLMSVTIPSSVTSIGASAFSGCPNLSTVTIPDRFVASDVFPENYETLTEVTVLAQNGKICDRAFENCRCVTSVTISEGITEIGESAFENCRKLESVTVPASVKKIDAFAFYGCGRLKTVTYLGEVPEIESAAFEGTSVNDSAAAQTVAVVVTNVIVHYVTNSRTSDSVIPDTTAGIVNIVAEIDSSKAVAITEAWAAQYPDFESTFGSDFGKALTMPTGKKDGAGNPMLVWQDYVAGTDPTKKDDVFTASITFDKGTGMPVISWSPELTAAEAAKREYKKYGKVKLTDEWVEISDATAENYNFFKVSVGMK